VANRPVIASLLCLALVAGACSFASEEVGQEADNQVTPTTVPNELAFVDETESDATFHLALTRSASWDPIELSMGDQSAVIVSDLLHDGLTESSTAGSLRPGLATSWESSSDFRSWTFTLDLARTSGDEVIASFDRLRADGASTTAAVLLDDVQSIEASGSDAVTFVLRNGNAGFAWLLSGLQFSIVGEEPTGRYSMIDETESGVTFVSDSGPDIEISWERDGKATYRLLTLAQVDAAVVDPTLSRDAANRYGQQPSARSISRFYAMNLASKDLWDPRVREAVLMSVDHPAMMAKLPTAGFTADGVAAPSLAGFRYGACGSACVFNPQEARGLLRSAGSFPTLSIVYIEDGQAGIAGEIAQNLADVGLATELLQVTAEELPPMIADGSAEIFSFGWAAPAGSMDAVVAPLFASYSPLNITRFVSPEVDDLLQEAATTSDDVQRWDLLSQAHQAALARWTVIPVAVAHNGLVQSPGTDPIALRPDGSIDTKSLG
jgi:ABC-type transport system substrate-binding protein